MAANTAFSIEELVRVRVREEISKLFENTESHSLCDIAVDIKPEMALNPAEICPIDLSKPAGNSHPHQCTYNDDDNCKNGVEPNTSYSNFDTGNGLGKATYEIDVITLDSEEEETKASMAEILNEKDNSVSPELSSTKTNFSAFKTNSIIKEEMPDNVGTSTHYPFVVNRNCKNGIARRDSFTQTSHRSKHLQPRAAEDADSKTSNPIINSNSSSGVNKANIQIKRKRKSDELLSKAKRAKSPSSEITSCSICNKAFHSARGVKIHMAIHKRELEHDCDVCAKRHIYYLSKIRRQQYATICTLHCNFCKTTAALFNLD